MIKKIGIVEETKNIWERRVPLVPEDVKALIASTGAKVFIQPSEKRIFPDHQYETAGAVVAEDLSECELILGIKEIPVDNLLKKKIRSFQIATFPFSFFKTNIQNILTENKTR